MQGMRSVTACRYYCDAFGNRGVHTKNQWFLLNYDRPEDRRSIVQRPKFTEVSGTAS
jgi:hypothetical protein